MDKRASIVKSAIIHFEEERSRHKELFERLNVIDKLLRWLAGDQSSSVKWVLLLGSPGIGKSAIIHELLNRLPGPVAYHFIRREHEGWDRPEAVVQNLCARIEHLFPEIAGLPTPSEPNLGELLRLVSKICLVPYNKRLFLVIDGLDEAAADGAGKNPLPRFLPRIVPAGVVILCASRPMYAHLEWITSLEHVRTLDLDKDEWAPSNRAATRELCLERARRMTPPLTPEVINAVVESAGGNILHACLLCDWLEGQPVERRTAAGIAQRRAGLIQRILSDMDTLEPARRELIMKGLGLACAAREALPEYLFGELIGLIPNAGAAFLRATRHLLREEPAHWHGGTPGYRLYHEHLREALIEKLGDAVIREHHRTLISSLAKWPADSQDPHRRRYALRHAVPHRLQAGDVPAARRLCTDMSYLQAKCQAHDIPSIEREIEAVIEAMIEPSKEDTALDLTALLAALRAEVSRITAHPGSLPALIYDRLRSAGWSTERIEGALDFHGGLPPLRLMHGVRLSPAPLRTISGHDKPIVACAVSPDGHHALSASSDGALRLCALVSGDILMTMQGHEDELTACAFTPDGRLAVSTSIDGTARLWDLQTGLCHAVLDNDGRGATACAVSPDGQTIVIGSDRGDITLWDARSRRRIGALKGHTDYVTACLIPTAGRLVTSSRDRTVRVWDLHTGACLHTLGGAEAAAQPTAQVSEQEWITAIAALPGGAQIVAAAGSGALTRWDLTSGQHIQQFGAGQGRVDALAVHRGGSHLLCGMKDGTLQVWDLVAERRVLRIPAHSGAVSACAVTPDGRRVLSASTDRHLRLWEIGGTDSLVSQDGHSAPVTACAITPDGRLAVSASEDRTLKVWDIKTGACLTTLEGHTDLVTACAISADGHHVLSGARDGSVLFWTLDLERDDYRVHTAAPHKAHVTGCGILPGGSMITASQDGALHLRSLETPDRPSPLGEHGSPIIAIAVTPHGARLLSIGKDSTTRLWDMTTRRSTGKPMAVPGSLLTGALTPNGKRAVLAFADGRIELRDLQGKQLVRTIPEHKGRVFGCTVSPDGKRIITASEDGTVRVHDLDTADCLGTNVGTTLFRCVASTDKVICAGDQDGNVWILHADLTPPRPDPPAESKTERDLLTADGYSRLRNKLAGLVGTLELARLILTDAELDERLIRLTGTSIEFWGAILEEANKRRKLGRVVGKALEQYPADETLLWAAEQLGLND